MDVNLPRVTFCALSYNSGAFTELAIRSALNSGYPNLEIICLDDCSTDSSSSVLRSLSKELGFDFHENQVNLGIPETCNTGLRLATGDYFIVMGDDVVLPNRIQGDVEILESNPGIGVVSSEAEIIDHRGQSISPSSEWSNEKPPGLFIETAEAVWLRGSRIFTPTATYRTRVLREMGGWDRRYDIEDKPMFIRFAKNGVKGWHRREITTLYRRHNNNFSAKFREGSLKQDLLLVKDFQLKIPNWRIRSKFVKDMHYWMLFLGTTRTEAETELRDAGMGSASWTAKSLMFRLLFLILTFFRPARYVSRNVSAYLFPKRVS